MAAIWSLSEPIFAGPDEPSHVVKAAAVARGELIGRDRTERVTPDQPPPMDTEVRVPAIFGIVHDVPRCYAFRPAVAADCAPAFTGPRSDAKAITTAGHYPPLYYAVVGLPTLVFPSVTGVYLMRLVGAALCAALLASALASAFASARRRALLLGCALALTPMVFFVSSVVNPNALEISAAVCLWASMIVLVVEGGSGADRRLVTRLGVAGSVLVLSRGLSPLWLALIALTALAAARPDTLRSIARRRDVRLCAGGLAAATALALAWILVAGSLELRGQPYEAESATKTIRTSLGKTDLTLRQMIGYFGWVDVETPALGRYLWTGALGATVLAALAFGRRRHVAVLAVLLVAVVVLPVVLESTQAEKFGFFWQGRYTLPLAVGVPILAAFAVADRVHLPPAAFGRSASVLLGALALTHVLAYAAAVRRWAVGTSGPVMYLLADDGWRPPLPAAVLLAGFLATAVLLATWLRLLATADTLGAKTAGLHFPGPQPL